MGRDITGKLQEQAFEMLGDPKNITITIISKMFGYHKNTGILFNTDDIITIGPEHSKFVKLNTKTRLGIYIANKFVYEDMEIFGYINKTLNGKTLGKIDDAIAEALKAGQITTEKVFTFLDKCQYLYGGGFAQLINTSISSTMVHLPKSSAKLKKDLLEKHKDEISAGNPQVASAIEKQVTADALEQMRKTKDPALALYDAGCSIDPYNNYKTMFVMKGAIIDNTGESPTGYKVVTSDYDNGISKDDMPLIADSLVTGAYSRGVLTQNSGYSGKMYNAIFQRIKLGPRGSDCGTKQTKKVTITEENKDLYSQYRFIMVNGKPVMLTPETIDKYVGKTVALRSPKFCKCKDPEYCNICFGDREYRVGVKNVGLSFNIAQGALMNASLKKFHDITIKTYNITTDDLMRFSDYAR